MVGEILVCSIVHYRCYPVGIVPAINDRLERFCKSCGMGIGTYTFEVDGEMITFFRSPNGSYSGKFNRTVKLAKMFTGLDLMMKRYADKGGFTTLNARLACACRLMLHTGIRVGNESSAEGYMTTVSPYDKTRKPEFVQTYGLTTLLPEHVMRKKGGVYMNFLGKRSVRNTFVVTGDLADHVEKIKLTAQPPETLFEITAHEFTKFIKCHVGSKFTPKDLRTLRANIEAWKSFNLHKDELVKVKTKSAFNALVKQVCIDVSEKLNNTASVCKTSYIDPYLWDYMYDIAFPEK